ncbi:MAG: right-handed parallel beta-helix repeat-containing protein [Planctomycetales bacterium]|nr:right-handed parallel beta-helix repeat-containing protein [Planctomycetales bacterium]
MRRAPFHLIGTIGFIILAASQVDGRDLYVNNLSGNDRNNGQLAEQSAPGEGPTRTIQRVISLASFGDRIVIANTGEPYRECISLQTSRNSGSVSFPFVIEGNGAILDGSGVIPVEDWQPFEADILAYRPSKLKSYQQVFLDGRPAERIAISDRSSLNKLKPKQYCRVGQELYFRVEAGKTPGDYDLQQSVHRAGITLYGVQNVHIRNLIVQGFQIDGISASDNAFDCKLVGVTARGNGRSGVNVGGASKLMIDSCVIGDNSTAQLRTEGWSTTVVVSTELLESTAPAFEMNGGKLKIDGEAKFRPPQISMSKSPLHRP